MSVATTFVVAVQYGENTVERACESLLHPIPQDRIDRLRDFGTLVIANASDVTRPGDIDRTIDIPGPAIPITHGPPAGATIAEVAPHICGVLVTVSSDADDADYVSDVSTYCSD